MTGPVEVELRHPPVLLAWQVTADTLAEVQAWAGDQTWPVDPDQPGRRPLRPGDWVLRGTAGRFFGVEGDEFDGVYVARQRPTECDRTTFSDRSREAPDPP